MRNYIQPGKTIAFTNITSNPIASGELVVIGALIGVSSGAVAAGDDGEMVTEGVFSLPKASAEDIAAGELLYYDAGDAELTKTGDPATELVGVATAAAGAGVLVVNCKLGVHGLMGATP